MSAAQSSDPSQRWIDRAILSSASVPELISSLVSVEPLIIQNWLMGQSAVLPVNLMTEDDLVH